MEGGADIDVRGHCNLTLVLILDNKLHKRQSLAGIIFSNVRGRMTAGKKRLKDKLLFFVAHAAAIVLHTHPDRIVKLTYLNIDRRAVRRIFDLAQSMTAVTEQTEKHLLQFRHMTAQLWQLIGIVLVDRDIFEAQTFGYRQHICR